ncbi:sulfurtransferase [Novosphingobium sp. M1R2S20]|uniref:Sulfurtransferase n=1 Tax=Novosphingobium rhizovicinum TaxID=3228928 RepID=A0ABV3RA19_9SPHN
MARSKDYETIVSVEALRDLVVEGSALLLIDCGFDLTDPEQGRKSYFEGHLPGARHIDLEKDMSGAANGKNGRHPLPARTAFAATMRHLGMRGDMQVIAYDNSGGIYAARFWWMLRWLGHSAVAVLDGGKQVWIEAGLPLESGEPVPAPQGDVIPGAVLVGEPVGADELMANLESGELQVIDARDGRRFAGEPHALDSVPGHIPGATNRFYRDNLDEVGRFRSPVELAGEFRTALAGKSPDRSILQCGSGVTACHNALAMELAGMKGARLYPGSWSEWTSDPARPVAKEG